MTDQGSSPLENIDMNNLGEALASAGGEQQQAADPAQDSGQQAPGDGGAPAGGGEGGEQGAAQGGQAPKAGSPPVQSLDFILDIPLRVTVELGRSKMPIREILQLGQGSVVELTKFAGEPLEVLVNDKLIARGEVVVVNEKFGIRLTDIISPVERIEQLK